MNSDKTFFGHPRGLATLFFTEMWERFSYYGMRALLLLFMVSSAEKGGMAMDAKTGGAIYGLYTMFVYLLSLPGGWLADKLFGLRNAVFYGGCIITLGHFCMAIPSTETFFLGLLLITIGTGLLKPNISSLVGTLYAEGDNARRDAGFSIFYMGINIGATISPLVTGYLGQRVGWHWGFGAAGIGMALGTIQYALTTRHLGTAGILSTPTAAEAQSRRTIRYVMWAVVAALGVLVFLLFNHVIVINPVAFAKAMQFVLLGCAVVYFAYVLILEKLDETERKRVMAIGIFFFISALFYAGFEQQGSTLNLFAERYTNMFGWPSSYLQSVPTIYVVMFVPVVAWLWQWLAKRKMNPSIPAKLSLGLIFMGLGFAVMIGASGVVAAGDKPWPTWLAVTYLLHTLGEICLYPIGLSAVTKLAPQRLVGQMMGVWFMSLALGNLNAGIISGEFDENAILQNPSIMVDLFTLMTKVMIISGLIVLLLSKPIRKLIGNVE